METSMENLHTDVKGQYLNLDQKIDLRLGLWGERCKQRSINLESNITTLQFYASLVCFNIECSSNTQMVEFEIH